MNAPELTELRHTVEALEQALASLPAVDAFDRARYQCERLIVALGSSHGEGVRFAAFTLNKLLKDHAAELPPTVPGLMDDLRRGLEQSGIHI